MPSSIDTFKPGQNILCTIKKTPRTEDAQSTLMRLMRQDKDVKKGLRKGQRIRRQRMNVYNRGNRDWTSRERVGKLVNITPGSAWTMPFTVELATDLKGLEKYLEIKAQ